MAVRPVKFISDIETRKQIIKTDSEGTVLFSVSGTIESGAVETVLPLTASGIMADGYGYIADLNISGSDLPNLGFTGPVHNVYAVLAAIDTKINNSVGLSITGSFNSDGTKNIQLADYTVADMDFVSVDVMVKYAGTSTYTNDLISVEISGNVSADKIHIILSAPALTNLDFYRIIVNKILNVS